MLLHCGCSSIPASSPGFNGTEDTAPCSPLAVSAALDHASDSDVTFGEEGPLVPDPWLTIAGADLGVEEQFFLLLAAAA